METVNCKENELLTVFFLIYDINTVTVTVKTIISHHQESLVTTRHQQRSPFF